MPPSQRRHLSEFKGQTIAVDAYVWLHKGVYSCATELATGKPTHKYVDYAMHRVRLLRHFGIEPYVVFDGGPLPAKRGTESERKQKREENLSRGKAFAAQGKHSQARDCFIKCVDVTPQMAFQCIKALKAENVQYVVAPYEADAQLAYLERVGLVSAILTEDSDLLVFGCRNVLLKLDHVASTVCHISCDDFGSVRSTALDSSSINLHGWSDTQFRAMAILSGCDYLPSIPGIGLKTANNLLRKWKTAEGVVRAVMLEGKKSVPNGYMRQFTLAEKCFLFQRVYDPLGETLVHLRDLEGDWDDEVDAYVGEDIDAHLAIGIAVGDVDPITREPMTDINPSFKPGVSKQVRKTPKSPAGKDKGKAKAAGGILNFFGPNPVIPRAPPPSKVIAKPSLIGTSSGKRRLGEIMDADLANRRQQLQGAVQSKFFSITTPHRTSTPRRSSDGPVAGPSQVREDNKENVYMPVDDDEEDTDILSTLSLKANVSPTQDLNFDVDYLKNEVEQEDGYMSPMSTYSQTQELSSPATAPFTPLKKKKRKSSPNEHDWSGEQDDVVEGYDTQRRGLQDDDFDADPISSPISTVKKKRRRSCSPAASKAMQIGRHLRSPTRSISTGNNDNLVSPTISQISQAHQGDTKFRVNNLSAFAFNPRTEQQPIHNGPDLQSCLGIDGDEAGTGEDECRANAGQSSLRVSGNRIHFTSAVRTSNAGLGEGPGSELRSKSGSSSPPSASPQTPSDEANTIPTFPRRAAVEPFAERIAINVATLEPGMIQNDTDLDDDPEENAMKSQAERVKQVSKSWRKKWALTQLQREDSTSSASSASEQQDLKPRQKRDEDHKKRRQSAPMALVTNRIRRDETNVTPLGKHSLAKTGTNRPFVDLRQQQLVSSVPPRVKVKPMSRSSSLAKKADTEPRHKHALEKRSSLVFFNEHNGTPVSTDTEDPLNERKKIPKPRFRKRDEYDVVDDLSDEIVEISPRAWTALNKLR
ncbi:hypothetical protein NP233_g5213 [Leucocoprinus birnbaumii]|uniref:Exonuclease 1 n=1 Tax=Leucocoprinus birnbaumii TaxID=56174 RepID=A0AAD5VT95_9AGAR|nr:hypothetical protein NP233_g5213 [Leucocoprinus birnbaumii]